MANIKKFGQELMKGNFGTAFKSLSETLPIEPYAYRNGMFFFGSGEAESFFQWSGVESSLKAYTQCPELQSIINRRAYAHMNGKRYIIKATGKDKGKEDTSEYAEKCRKLLNKPNPFQSGIQFETQLKIYVDVYGWCVILPIYAGKTYASKGLSEASALFLIPPYMLTWRETGFWRNQRNLKDVIAEMVLTVGGEMTNLDLDQIVIIKDIVPRMYTGTVDGTGGMGEVLLLPESRVRAQEKPINNIIAAYESRGELISYAGSQGIVSPPPSSGQYMAMSLTTDEEKDLQRKFRGQYGIMTKQYRYIISPQALQYTPMGRPTKDLMLFEEIDADVRALCNAWYYPWKLLADSGSSLNGTEVEALTRNLYQDAIIPEANAIHQQLADAFKDEENGTIWEMDYSHIPALQANAKESAESRKALDEALSIEYSKGLITLDDWLIEIGKEPLPDGLGQVRATDPSSSGAPLAVTIGVGGVQGLIEVLTAQGLDPSAKQSVLEIVFGLLPADAARMVVSDQPAPAATTE